MTTTPLISLANAARPASSAWPLLRASDLRTDILRSTRTINTSCVSMLEPSRGAYTSAHLAPALSATAQSAAVLIIVEGSHAPRVLRIPNGQGGGPHERLSHLVRNTHQARKPLGTSIYIQHHLFAAIWEIAASKQHYRLGDPVA